jgi:cohesin complex subunit SCC1
MFYASFVLNKKGPLARIWLAAHWDKKLTKAHVFETNIDSSVEAILKPKVKMALRTSGHLLLGVVRIYSRKAKYLLADCNEAFVKIKMAFRPGVVDLPEENREAAVAAITLQENFHDFETTLADLEDISVQAQFSVNQSRPEEITMREDLGSITLMGDDGFGDVGFDEREILHGDGHLDDGLYKPSELDAPKEDDRPHSPGDKEKPMDIDLPPPVVGDSFGDGFMDADDVCDEDNDDNFGDIDQDFFGQNFMGTGGLFEDTPAVSSMSAPQDSSEVVSASPKQGEPDKTSAVEADAEETVPLQATTAGVSAISSTGGEQTTLVHNEEEAFALEPLDITTVPGTERKGKRKRKLIVDEQKGIPSETMKLQLSDTSDIVTSLDLAPPTKKLMHWKETGGVEKIFVLPGRPIISKVTAKLFTRNLVCKPVSDDFEPGTSRIDLDMAPEIARENERNSTLLDATRQSEMSTIIEEPSNIVETTKRVNNSSIINRELAETSLRSEQISLLEPSLPVNESIFEQIPDISIQPIELPTDPADLAPAINPLLDDGPASVAPFSVAPASVAPLSVPPALTFDDLEQELEAEPMPENAEQEEKRWSKRTQQMQQVFDQAFTFSDNLSFKDMARNHNRKQAASRFYTLLVLRKHQIIHTEQNESFGDIIITKGPNFGIAC